LPFYAHFGFPPFGSCRFILRTADAALGLLCPIRPLI
jgi:hypothetical protein